jgi:hypothetical protein
VVSKEEVAAQAEKGAAGHGGRPAALRGGWGLGGPAPQNGRSPNTGKKTSQAVGRRAVGYNLVVLENAFLQSSCKYQTHFLAPPYEQLTRCLVLWSKDAMRVIVF